MYYPPPSRRYTPRLAEVVMHLYALLFPKFSKNMLRVMREGRCVVKLSDVLASVPIVFLAYWCPVSMDRISLTRERRERLMSWLQGAAVTFEEFLAGWVPCMCGLLAVGVWVQVWV